MDKIVLKNLKIFARHGALQFEREEGQDFLVTVEIDKYLNKASRTDDLNDTVDYGKMADLVVDAFASKSHKLIEAAAKDVISVIIEKFPRISRVAVEVSKPNAPLNVKFENVSVRLERSLHKVYVGIGTNEGDLKANIDRAIEGLGLIEETRIKSVASYIKTKPWGKEDQPDFLNTVVELESWCDPREFLKACMTLENQMGRVRTEKWGPRIIDLDVLLFDREVIAEDDCIIPHPYLLERDFVLKPLKEIAPFAVHPLTEQFIKDIKINEH